MLTPGACWMVEHLRQEWLDFWRWGVVRTNIYLTLDGDYSQINTERVTN